MQAAGQQGYVVVAHKPAHKHTRGRWYGSHAKEMHHMPDSSTAYCALQGMLQVNRVCCTL